MQGAGGCGGLYANILRRAVEMSAITAPNIMTVGLSAGNANTSFWGWYAAAGLSNPVVNMGRTEIPTANFSQYKLMYIPSDSANTPGKLSSLVIPAHAGYGKDLSLLDTADYDSCSCSCSYSALFQMEGMPVCSCIFEAM